MTHSYGGVNDARAIARPKLENDHVRKIFKRVSAVMDVSKSTSFDDASTSFEKEQYLLDTSRDGSLSLAYGPLKGALE